MAVSGDRLAEIALFAPLAAAERERLARAARLHALAPGAVLVREGEVGSQVFVITAGVAEVRRGGEAIGRVAAGDVIGEVAAVGGWEADNRAVHRRTASVVAASDLQVIELPGRELQRLARSSPAFSDRLWATLRARMD